ncbi:hypothetical protein [Microvirga pudoricolor]|uniref:hypothetical protein n=1 Tax=Microvirga pudoricolor TaxID=2778729 RepID=UPI00194FFAF1|nr:hypothetical protein [Microvirga pudoricolor]MBM6592778.1 hypothetical protein [Microvirga pudoricolor]
MAGKTKGLRLAALLPTMALAAGLAACQGDSASLRGGSPEGVPIVLESIDGAPAPVKTALVDELTTAAASRKVELVGTGTEARYRVRGYLTTETAGGETSVAYVWDVFDAQKRRAQRLAGSSPVKVASWSELDKETLAKLAGSSMDEIAEFLAASKAETPFQTAAASGAEPEVTAQ